ncbi:MAG: peptidoglycan-binding domain-containing protein [bacterium]|nr:peptidoglycan-binding domain-containing protein [bacterium]
MKHKIAPLLLAFLFFAGFVGTASAALSEAQISAIVSLLSSFGAEASVITNVNASLRGQVASNNNPALTCLTLDYSLSADASDATTNGEVSKLQRFLAQDSSLYSGGLVTGYFGPQTEVAVQRWQERNGIVSNGTPDTTGYGFVGSRTRSAMRCGTATTPVVTTNTTTIPPPPAVSAIIAPAVTTSVTPIPPPPVSPIIAPAVTNDVAPTDHSVAILSPNSGGEYSMANPLYVTWTSSFQSSYINVIRLRSVNSGVEYNLLNNTPNDGAQSVMVPSTVPGGLYYIEIKTQYNDITYFARSDGYIKLLAVPTVTLNASSLATAYGQEMRLYWNSTNATRCVLKYDSFEQAIGASGSLSFAPLHTTNYSVWCANDPGTGKDGPASSSSVTVTVADRILATPAISLATSLSSVATGQQTVLSWNAVDATRCHLQYDSVQEELQVNGSISFSPQHTTNYSVWCANDPGTGKDGPSSSSDITVTVAN